MKCGSEKAEMGSERVVNSGGCSLGSEAGDTGYISPMILVTLGRHSPVWTSGFR
jgi:hypothetical protein